MSMESQGEADDEELRSLRYQYLIIRYLRRQIVVGCATPSKYNGGQEPHKTLWRKHDIGKPGLKRVSSLIASSQKQMFVV